MLLRAETKEDITGIRRVVEAAFGQKPEAELIDRLREDGHSVISLVAVDAGEVVGHVLFSVITAPFRALGLAPVSVMPHRQRAGIGSRLVRAGLECVKEDSWQGVFVLGAPEFYERFGFSPALARNFESPYAGPHFMLLSFHGDWLTTEGIVSYAPAFAALE